MNNLRIIGTKMLSIAVQYTKTFAHYIACKELTLPKAVVLGLNLKAQGRAEVMAINFC